LQDGKAAIAETITAALKSQWEIILTSLWADIVCIG
jgi:hypothetical protein